MQKTSLVFFRNDLRLHDNEALFKASQQGLVVPVFCFDPRQFGLTALGKFPKTGSFRAQFLLESVAELRQSLKRIGSDLVVRTGTPESIVPELAQATGATSIFMQGEVTSEETSVESGITKRIAEMNKSIADTSKRIKVEFVWGLTMYHKDDLPFGSIDRMPEIFTQFRKSVESSSTRIRPPFPTPERLAPLPSGVDPGAIPTLEELGLKPTPIDPRSVLPFKGGETAALARMKEYIWDRDMLKVYKETRNGLKGADFSSKFSVWLWNGCLSPRAIYHEVKRYEKERVSNESTYWLIFELLWRDFFKFIGLKYGDRLFYPTGLRRVDPSEIRRWSRDPAVFKRWQNAETGYPFVDANMRELLLSGFMSNRGRQNVASFLVKDMGMDWRLGAEWFESVLIDYDPCSNYGNWQYVAGVGNDPREDRYFNVLKQGSQYDPNAEYVFHWMPELSRVRSLFESGKLSPVPSTHAAKKMLEPYLLTLTEQTVANFKIGVDYPSPIAKVTYTPRGSGSAGHDGAKAAARGPAEPSSRGGASRGGRGGGWSRGRGGRGGFSAPPY